MTINEYAKSRGISYEAARKSIKTHAAELEGHLEKHGRAQVIDDAGVAILNQYRQSAQPPEPDDANAQMQAQLQEMSNQIQTLQKDVENLQQQIWDINNRQDQKKHWWAFWNR